MLTRGVCRLRSLVSGRVGSPSPDRLLVGFAALSRFDTAIMLGLCLSFFHGFTGFLGALGANFRAFLAFFVDHSFPAKPFDKSLVSTIALLPSRADNPQVATGAVAKARSNGFEKLVDGFARHQIRGSLTAGGKIPAFAEGDHFFHLWTHRLGLGQRSFNALLDNQRRDQVPQQGAAVGCVTT